MHFCLIFCGQGVYAGEGIGAEDSGMHSLYRGKKQMKEKDNSTKTLLLQKQPYSVILKHRNNLTPHSNYGHLFSQ